MKTKITRLVAALFVLALPARVHAQFTFTTNNGAITITGYAGSGAVAIPAATNGYPVTSIGALAFNDNSGITSVFIPSSVTNLGVEGFEYCTSLTNFETDPANPAYSSLDGVLFDKAQAALVQFPCGLGGSYTIPATVTSIGGGAFFYCTSLTNITIPGSVTNIGDHSFQYCSSVTSLSLPASVTGIGNEAFMGWNMTSVSLPASVTSIGYEAFASDYILTNITVDAVNPAYANSGGVLFDKAQTTLVQFPAGVGGNYAIPASVTSLAQGAFLYAYHLTSVNIPAGFTNIAAWAFADCLNLTNVGIPASVTSIGVEAFADCYGLATVTISDNVTFIDEYAFFGSGLTSVDIPASVTNLGYSALSACASLTSINVDAANPVYSSLGGVLFDETQATLLQFPCGLGRGYTIPDGVTSIGPSAFFAAYQLNSAIIPGSVTNIGEAVFDGCLNLTSVNIPSGVTSIGIWAFIQCTSLTSVYLPATVTSLGENAFGYCSSLTAAYFLGNPPPDDGTAFTNDPAIVYYQTDATGWGPTFGSVPTMTWSPFTYTLNDGAINITGYDTAAGLDMVIPASINGYPVISIGAGAFSSYLNLTGATIPNGVTSIGADAFYQCLSLTSVNLPNSVTNLGDEAFFFCDSLTNVTVPASLTSIGYDAFFNCYNLTSAYFLGNAPPDDGSAFTSYDVTDPTTVYYLYGTTGWGSTFGSVPAVLWNPQANTESLSGGQFGFSITGPADAIIVVEACTNLSNSVWLPVATNTLSDSGTSTFSDTQSSGYPSRFYRFSAP